MLRELLVVLCRECDVHDGRDAEERQDLKEAFDKCASARPALGDPIYTWHQHPLQPRPFYAIDYKDLPNNEKLTWLRQELGNDAELPDFAAKILELLGDKRQGEGPQRDLVVKLNAGYTEGRVSQKPTDLSPAELTAFFRVWDPKALNRFDECRNQHQQPGGHCSNTCRCAGKTVCCRYCHKKLEDSYCADCKKGQPPLVKIKNEGLEHARRLLFSPGEERRDPDYETAWKRLKRI